MDKHSFKTFCRIPDYLEAAHPELTGLLRGTCSIMNLNTKRKQGLTMIVPSKEHMGKIADLAYSSEVKDANLACDMLNAHIIKDFFRSGSDWKNSSKHKINSLYPPQLVEVKDTKGDEVVFANGAVAVLDKKFVDSSRRQNLSVWIMKSGSIGIDGKPAKEPEIRKKQAVKGSREAPYEELSPLRVQIANAVENLYIVDQVNKRMGVNDVTTISGGCYPRKDPASNRKDAFLEHSLSLLKFLRDKHQDVFIKVLPLVSFQKIDFFNLLEPYVPSADLISEDIIREWWGSAEYKQYKLQPMIDSIIEDDLSKKHGDSVVLSGDHERLLLAINEIRKIMYAALGKNPREAHKAIFAVYGELVAKNRVISVENVFPGEYLSHVSGKDGLKLLAQDEMRYVTKIMFDKLEGGSLHGFDHGYFEQIICYIAQIQGCLDEKDIMSALQLVNCNKLQYSLDPTPCAIEIKGFVGSTFFLYTPLSAKEILNFPIKNVVTRPNYTKNVVWKLNAEPCSQQHLANSADDNDNVIAMLKGLKVGDSNLVEELKKAISRLNLNQ